MTFAYSAQSIYTGGGHDALAINAENVESVYTDESSGPRLKADANGQPQLTYSAGTSSNDAVAIRARRADSIYTGGGNDAVAIQAGFIGSVYAGKGNDSIALTGGVVSGIHAGDGNDAISVQAANL